MPEYVYALHDFLPEHEDEITFLAGQPIEVIERDDQYNDGWWQGRNVAGKIGLFPQSYTTPAAPPTLLSTSSSPSSPSVPLTTPSDPSEPLREEPDSISFRGSDDESRIGIAIGDPDHAQEEVMKATMTDVQKAIEQLGHNDRDGAQSFSFASTGGGDTDRETDGTETDGEIGEGWHRSARDKLAEEARKVVEAKAAAAAEDTQVRTSAPPIDVEMSDESEAEEDDSAFQHLQHMHFTRDHPHIPEEDESEEARRNSVAWNHRRKESNETSSAILPREDLPSPVEDSGERTATANQTSFTSTSPPPRSTRSPNLDENRSPQSLPTPSSPNTRKIVAPAPIVPVDATMVPIPVSPKPTVQATPTPSVVREVSTSLPSPALTAPNTQRNSQQASKHNSVSSTGKASTGSVQSPPEMELSKKSTPPSEWSVEEVVDWLKSKGFGSDVYDKFIEQEITGDVLLELDINLLKVEIGIVAFGKRMRIANAIAELRRPPSIIFTDHQPQHSHSQSISHSISQSLTYPYSPSGSTQQSLNSPMFAASMGAAMNRPASFGGTGGPESPRPETFASPFLPKRVSSLSSTGASLNGGVEGTGVAAGIEKAMMVGIVGLGLGALPPGQLVSSPSDSALDKQTGADPEEPSERVDDDRGALSENESVPSTSKQRRRLFGYSVESSSSGKDKNKPESINTSKDALAPSPASGTASPRPIKRESQDDSSIASRHSRGKRNNEGVNKAPERLSLFGGSFSTSIGKSRKPPPRITSALLEESAPSEKTSTLSLSRLYGRKASGRPSTSDGTAVSSLRNGLRASGDTESKEREKAKSFDKPKDEDKATSKATNSSPKESRANPIQAPSPSQDSPLNGRGPNVLKSKKNIIDQIGQPDHEGWMRKKGDHYNSWKVRYFIIKGPHLYILRSNNKAEAKIKGYINIVGYKVVADENIDPGRYGFRIVHETDKTHFFSSDEQAVVREWMKAIMKATIGRDYSKPVVSSVNIPTIPLTVAQAMNPAPRPPSPTARAATQKALRRENPNQLSTRDARVLMGLPSPNNAARTDDPQESERVRLESFFASQPVSAEPSETGHGWAAPKTKNAPPRPSREARRGSAPMNEMNADSNLIDWANSHLPRSLQVIDPAGPLFGGLALLRLAEDMMGKPASPPIPDTAFPSGPNDDKLDGLFRLFDFLLDNDVKMGSVSINDVRQGKREKVIQLIKALKTWEDRRREIVKSIGHGSVQTGPFVMSATWR